LLPDNLIFSETASADILCLPRKVGAVPNLVFILLKNNLPFLLYNNIELVWQTDLKPIFWILISSLGFIKFSSKQKLINQLDCCFFAEFKYIS